MQIKSRFEYYFISFTWREHLHTNVCCIAYKPATFRIYSVNNSSFINHNILESGNTRIVLDPFWSHGPVHFLRDTERFCIFYYKLDRTSMKDFFIKRRKYYFLFEFRIFWKIMFFVLWKYNLVHSWQICVFFCCKACIFLELCFRLLHSNLFLTP